jgi:choline dehydrogenase-like flavoprotein
MLWLLAVGSVLPARFDYIIVGGGTAGCVLANRLSADPSKNVLLLEPGKSPRGSLKVAAPVALVKLFNHPKWDWRLKSEPTRDTAERAVHLCRGRCLGGSSATNALLYHRGTRQDFDSWGIDGWGSEAMLRSFLKVEGNRREALADSPYHSTHGPVSVEDARYSNPLSSAFVEAALQAGYAANPDFNDWSRPQEGVGRFQLQTRRGKRAHAAATHLRPAARRSNLHVRTGARASRVEFGEGAVASGVVYLDEKGAEAVARVVEGEGEVIVCAGAIHSPHLLKLSGVGPAPELQSFGIDVVSDVPGVGANLADHPAVSVGVTVSSAISITDEMFLGRGVLNPARVVEWLARGSGPLATTGCDYGGFFKCVP